MSLGSGGVTPPQVWPYNTSSLLAAKEWCCAANHTDCGGITYQQDAERPNGRYEVRGGSTPMRNPAPGVCNSYPRLGDHKTGQLNKTNVTVCIMAAEIHFTQTVGTDYTVMPTNQLTAVRSATLAEKYAQYFPAP